MLWAVMGVGMLFNAIKGNQQAAQMREMQQAQQAQNQAMLKSMQAQQRAMNESPFASMLQIQTGLPDYPEQSFANLQNMQSQHMDARQTFVQSLDQELQQAKTAFFEEKHYDTKLGADGKREVATREDGKPVVKQGPETPETKLPRLAFEGQKKSELQDLHNQQKDSFLAKERESFKEFLAQNREQLGNPYVQGELQRMVVNTRKKSLELQQSQEDDRFRVDMPPSEEIAAKIDNGMKKLHDLDRQHVEAEENSEDAKELMEHDQQVAAILYEEKQKAQQEKNDGDFLLDPRKMMAAAQQRNQPRDVGQVLPSYLTNAMYDLGIYSV